MANPRISLEQWRSLLAVVDAGGYAQAAEVLHKSQSAVTYAVQKMETLLGVKVFEVVGRKAHLTPTGEVLYRRAKALLDEAGALEGAAATLVFGSGMSAAIALFLSLAPGARIEGPAVVEEFGSTTVVFPGQELTVDPHGILIVRAAGKSAETRN